MRDSPGCQGGGRWMDAMMGGVVGERELGYGDDGDAKDDMWTVGMIIYIYLSKETATATATAISDGTILYILEEFCEGRRARDYK